MKKTWLQLIQQHGNIFSSKDVRAIILTLVMVLVGFQALHAQSPNVTPTFDMDTQLTITAQSAIKKDISSLLQVSDPDRGQLLTWSIVSAAGRGKLDGFPAFSHSGHSGILPDQAISYESIAGQTGNDTFVIQISDGNKTSHLFFTVNIVLTETPLSDSIYQVASLKLEASKRNIEIVQSLSGLSVPFGTRYNELKQPAEVAVIYANQEKEILPVAWHQSNFNGNVAGNYILIGDPLLTPGSTNTNYIKAALTITVLPNSAPSALLISDSTLNIGGGQIDPDTQGSILTNFFITEDADDSVHTYQLVDGPGDSDNCKFGVRAGVLTLKSPEEIGDQTDFSIRVKSTDANNNSIEEVFILTLLSKEKLNTLEIPNTFSPNADGINDVWIVPGLENHTSVDIRVYDRPGFLMFHSNDPKQGWDGRNTNEKVIAGIYFYIIKIGDTGETKQGVLVVLTN